MVYHICSGWIVYCQFTKVHTATIKVKVPTSFAEQDDSVILMEFLYLVAT